MREKVTLPAPAEVEPFYSKLFGKLSCHFADLERVKAFAMNDAEIVIIAYGCTARSAQAAARISRERGLKLGLMQLLSLWLFPRRRVEEALANRRLTMVPELNMGQISREVKRVQQRPHPSPAPRQDRRHHDHPRRDASPPAGDEVMPAVHRSQHALVSSVPMRRFC